MRTAHLYCLFGEFFLLLLVPSFAPNKKLFVWLNWEVERQEVGGGGQETVSRRQAREAVATEGLQCKMVDMVMDSIDDQEE